MAVLSLSYLFGDAAARETMALLLDAGMGWRGIFFTGAALLALLLLANLLLLRETPQERGLPAPVTNPLNVYATPKIEADLGKSRTGIGLDLAPAAGEPFLLDGLSSLAWYNPAARDI